MQSDTARIGMVLSRLWVKNEGENNEIRSFLLRVLRM
jgi:hypothetical protein